jgi:DNA polymerase (family 10)
MPPVITELLQIPGMGPKRVRAIYDALHVKTIPELHRAAIDGKIHALPGFGEKTESHLIEAIEAHLNKARRFALSLAEQYATPLIAYLQATPGVDRVVPAGSFRRRQSTIGDLDILVTAQDAVAVVQRFVKFDDVAAVLSSGATRSGVLLRNGMQVDLRVMDIANFGAALVYFTGSKAHNIALRRIAQEQGLKISEYGVFRANERIAGESEESVYAAVGLPFIAPELRENRGELEAARTHVLPNLIELADLRGDLHSHTNASDGHDSVLDMALAARERGLTYLAVTDHLSGLSVAHGLDVERLEKQVIQIDRLNRTLDGITLLKGIEVDVLQDGQLDLPVTMLRRLDVVIAAVHSHMHLSREEQTERLLRAIENPYVSILAHPTGRLIGKREPYDVDLMRVIRKARAYGCHMELNAQPERLDLADTYCQIAKGEGVLVSINSDAHSRFDLDDLRHGIDEARRGWLQKDEVLNSRDLDATKARLRRPAATL